MHCLSPKKTMRKGSLILQTGTCVVCILLRLLHNSDAYVIPSRETRTTAAQNEHDMASSLSLDSTSLSRRGWLKKTLAEASAAFVTAATIFPCPATAEETATVAAPPLPTVELPPMTTFVDPVGLFSIDVPKSFYTLRRSAKGDLPDEKTGKGRRGSSIFTAGNMAKAEIIAVERFPTRVLLEENGIEATGDLSTIPGLGEAAAVATLINIRREKDRTGGGPSNTQLVPESLFLSEDKKELAFALRTEIDVQKPDLLMEQYGVSRLFRVTFAKASLRSNDGNVLAVFASALEQDFDGPDGVALKESVNKFVVSDRSMLTEKKIKEL